MNRKALPIVAAFLVLLCLVGTTPFTYAQTTTVTFGPQLQVTTIPEGDQVRKTGIIILGISPDVKDAATGDEWWQDHQPITTASIGTFPKACTDDPTKAAYDATNNPQGVTSGGLPFCDAQNLLSQHKLLITYNGATITWQMGSTTGVPVVVCNVLEKDKVNVIPDPKTGKGQQFPQENLMTKLVDVSDKFVCKVRWKSPAPGFYESDGVLDVYYTGPYEIHWAADNILTVEASLAIGRTVIFGSDIQDICVLAYQWWSTYGINVELNIPVPKPDWWIQQTESTVPPNAFMSGNHWVFPDALGPFTSCTDITLIQRDLAGVKPEPGTDPLAPA